MYRWKAHRSVGKAAVLPAEVSLGGAPVGGVFETFTTKGYDHKTPIRTSFDQRFAPVGGVLEGVGTHEHDIQQHSARPDVHCLALVRLAGQDLGREVRRGTNDGLALRLLDLRALGVAEVTNLDQGAGLGASNERVLELDVTVSDTDTMQILDATDELLEEVASVVLGESAGLADEAKELSPCGRWL